MEALARILGRIDRRLLYLGLVAITLLPLVFRWRLPLYSSRPAQMFYDELEAAPTDRIVVVSCDWDASTFAENRPQTVAVFRHLLRRDVRFAIANIGAPNGAQLAQAALDEAVRLEGRGTYGVDFVNFGYKVDEDAWVNSFARNIPGAVGLDWQGRRLQEMPVMRGVRRFGPDVSTLVVISASDTIRKYVGFMGPTGTKIIVAVTAVMAPDEYGLLDSGQIGGLLTGMKGAAEYEQLLRLPAAGTQMMPGQSFAHVYIVFLIVVGNLSVLFGRLAARRRA